MAKPVSFKVSEIRVKNKPGGCLICFWLVPYQIRVGIVPGSLMCPYCYQPVSPVFRTYPVPLKERVIYETCTKYVRHKHGTLERPARRWLSPGKAKQRA